MTYLEQLPRCPKCDRILRTKQDRFWCVSCTTFADETIHE